MAKSNKVDEKAVVRLIINGEQAKTSLREVRLSMLSLERQLLSLKKADDPAGFEKLRKELELTKRAHAQMVQEIRGGEGTWSKFKLSFKGMAQGAITALASGAAIGAVVSGLTKIVKGAGELSDSLADVQKQTGLAGQELLDLNNDLNQIKTRTPVEELRGLAAVAGKLGYTAKKDVLDFVKAADMINVALGEDLGGNVEEVVNDMGKLVEIFDLKREFGIEGALIKTASAINTIGASSAANEGYLVAWTKRFAGIAPNAGISMGNTLGLAATMDILGQTSELSATNVGKMIIAIGKDIPHFAKISGMSVKEFSKLLKNDANEAFLRVLEGAKSAEGGVEGMVKTLENLGIEGSEGAQVLGALTKNTKLLREQQDIANKAFDEGTSIMDEFNVKNTNAAAVRERIGKKITEMWESASQAITPVILLLGKLMGVVSELDEQMAKFNNQQKKAVAAEKNLTPLVERYDQLRTKVKLTADEQTELNKITKELAAAVPGAVTGWDAYGNAIDVNTWKVRDFVKEQKVMLETMRTQRKELLKEELSTLTKERARVQNELARGSVQINQGMGQFADVKLRDQDIAQRVKRLQELKTSMESLNEDLGALDGKGKPSSASPTPGTPTSPTNPGGNDTGGGGGESEKEKAAKETARRLEQVRQDLLKIKQQMTLDTLTEADKERQAVAYKYEEKRKQAKGFAKELAELTELEAQEMQAIRDKYNEKEAASFEKMMRGQLKGMNDFSKEKNKFHQEQADKEDERMNGEIARLESQYLEELRLAELYGFETAGIYTRWAEEINLIKKKQAIEEVKTEKEKQKNLTDEQQKAFKRELDLIELKRRAFTDIAQTIGNLFGIMAENESDFAEFQKAISLVQIGIDTGAALASTIRAVATGAVSGWEMIAQIAATVALVTGNMLKAKQMVSKSEVPEPPAFRAMGGATDLGSIYTDRGGDPQGWVRRPTLFSLGKRSYVAGEAGAEYVVSNSMLQDPVVADFVGMMEAMRQQKVWERGGMGTIANNTAAPATDPQLAETNRLLKALLNKTSKGFNYAAFEDYRDLIDNIRSQSSV